MTDETPPPPPGRGLILLLTLPLVAALAVLLLSGPIEQPQGYHQFADRRVLLGIPRFGDVITNLAFVVAGLLGLASCVFDRPPACFRRRRERSAFVVLFGATLATGLGSALYHLSPSDATLVWDRLAMAVAFGALLAAFIEERFAPARAPLWWLVALGVASVLVWAGSGDLRLYVAIQFAPLWILLVGLHATRSPYRGPNGYLWVVLLYAGAKVAEFYDHGLFALTHGLLSGHNLKHLLAASAAIALLHMVQQRRAVVGAGSDAQ